MWRCAIAKSTFNAEQRQRLEAGRKLATAAANLAAQTLCSNIVVLDVAGISPVTDYFLIATGTSPRQMRTVSDEIEEMARKQGYSTLSRSGYEGESWILLDLVDVVVHIFSADARQYYDLDNLWADARRVECK